MSKTKKEKGKPPKLKNQNLSPTPSESSYLNKIPNVN